jgi:hypothetical protein
VLKRWCRLIVQWFGPSWGKVGWTLFLIRLWAPNLFRGHYYDAVIWLLDGFLFAWWLIDATKQCAHSTVVKLSALLFFACFMPHSNWPIILLWLFYWVYLRD